MITLTCPRCKKSHEGPNNRCESCAKYARVWQKNRTQIARKNNKCITCLRPSEKSRCDLHIKAKSDAYQKSKNTSTTD